MKNEKKIRTEGIGLRTMKIRNYVNGKYRKYVILGDHLFIYGNNSQINYKVESEDKNKRIY